jgi:hypothetical protein
MALIQPVDQKVIYSNMIGSANSAGNVAIATINFASIFLNSDGITKVNDYTVQVQESGLYELVTPISISVASFTGNWTSYLEVGKNFVFSNYAQSVMNISACTGLYSILVELEKNDQFSLRSQIVGTITGHTTRCNFSDSGTNKNGGFTTPTITMKRI